MILIGEKINGAIPSAAAAIQTRDEAFIRNLAIAQTNAGASYLDVCAGTDPKNELETMRWLVELIQDTVETPLCIDSPNPEILKEIFPLVKRPGILNSVSGEGSKCEILYPLLQGNEWNVIALTCDNHGIPYDAAQKVRIADELITKADSYGIAPDRIFVDPLVMALSAVNNSLLVFADAVRGIKQAHPGVKITSGLSNISFGLPCRKAVNLNFLTMSMFCGMDSAILDPTNRETITTVLASEALLGRDKYCRGYANAYRKGLIGPVKKQ
jgi:5-methyltetrahydrofolate--homocysteine methyltransferase